MAWHHKNKIKASMAYIERLLNEIEFNLNGKMDIYESVIKDINQVENINDEIRNIKALLLKVKKDFSLEENTLKLSRLIETNVLYIWETLDELKFLEKTSGKYENIEKLNKYVEELKNHSDKLLRLSKK